MTDVPAENKETLLEVKEVKRRSPTKRSRLAVAQTQVQAELTFMNNYTSSPWGPSDVDKMESMSVQEFKKAVEACRFFYRRDPLASSVVNRMIDLGINGLRFSKNGLTENEFKVFTSLEDKLLEFSESMMMEYLVSGLVIPEIKYARVSKDMIKQLGIKKYDTLVLPVNMWVRDPNTVTINKTIISDQPSYFVDIPDELIYFIKNRGKYPDGTADPELYAELVMYYPEFVAAVESGAKKVKLNNPLIIRRRVMSDTGYPIPYLYPAIESLKHKRNLRRMDYSIASRVIAAIMLIKLGSDKFPVTEDDQDQFNSIKNQMLWRDGSGKNVERIFQLFANHTLSIEWVTPPTEALLDDKKYVSSNKDILNALGFTQLLITGEAEKSNAGAAEFSTIPAQSTIESGRKKINAVLSDIMRNISELNRFKSVPEVEFDPIQLQDFQTWITALHELYVEGNLSRDTYTSIFGYNYADEFEKRVSEQKELIKEGIPEFSPTPNSRNPNNGNDQPDKEDEPKKDTKTDEDTE